jgi:hypothetical protein
MGSMPRTLHALALGGVLLALGVAGCGGSSSSSSSSGSTAGAAGAAPGQRGGFASDPKVAACLKQAGIALPTGRRRVGGTRTGPPSGAPRTGTNGAPPAGASGRFAKMQAALKKCGISLPNRGPGGGPRGGYGGGAPPAQGSATTGASQ